MDIDSVYAKSVWLAEGAQAPADYLRAWGVPIAVIGVVLLLTLLKPIVDGLRALAESIYGLLRMLSPSLYSEAGREERAFRRRVATLLLQNLDLVEAELRWQRATFTNVRVTVESSDQASRRSAGRTTSRLTRAYRGSSLRRAIDHHAGHLVLLEGPPGAGKSVALRALARRTLESTQRHRYRMGTIALCVSLRDLHTRPDDMNATILKEYIESRLNPRGAPDLTKYFTDFFLDDLSKGRLILLLDSFDEIPSVLGSTHIDHSEFPYVDSIAALRGGGSSTCVVASRVYRGPRVPGWSKLELIGLSFDEQKELLAAYGLSKEKIPVVERLLLDPRAGFTTDLRNPLYLALLAEYMQSFDAPPRRPTEMFEEYVRTRLRQASNTSDESTIELITRALQHFAFDLTAASDSGLVGDADALVGNIRSQLPSLSLSDSNRLLAVAKRSSLVVDVESAGDSAEASPVAFAHRRVLEYFATRHAIQNPSALQASELATNKKWRETAVAMLQVGSADDKAPLLSEIARVIDSEVAHASAASDFTWTPAAAHVLEMLVAAYSSDARDLPDEIKGSVTRLADRAWQDGTIGDRKFALDCIPVLQAVAQPEFVKQSFAGSSYWLRMAALRDCSALHPLPKPVDSAIRRLLITLAGHGPLSYDAHVLDVDLRRLYDGRLFVRMRRILSAAPFVILLICSLAVLADFVLGSTRFSAGSLRVEVLYSIVLPMMYYLLILSTPPISYVSTSRIRRFIERVTKRWLGWRQLYDLDTLMVVVIITICLNIAVVSIYAVIAIAHGHLARGIAALIVQATLAVYTWGWGPSLLLGIHRRWLTDRLRPWEVVFVVRKAAPGALQKIRSSIGVMVGVVIFGAIFQAFWIALWLGVRYLLAHFAGGVGKTLIWLIPILLAGIVPAIIVVAVIKEILSRRRPRAEAAKGSLTATSFLERLCRFDDPLEASEYIHYLRLNQTKSVRTIPRTFVRELCRLVEANAQEPSAAPLQETDQDKQSAANETIRRFRGDGRLSDARLNSWRTSVLDELGQLDEFLRVR